MKTTRAAAVLIAMLAALPALAQDKEQAELPLKQVTMYTSGVAYYEHTGALPAGAEIRLQFEPPQINDVLKSMVVWGEAAADARVRYPSREPLQRQLSSFEIDLSADPSLAQLLTQLRGAEVTVSAPKPITGKVLTVKTAVKVYGDPPVQVTEHQLVLVTEAGIKTIPLDTVDTIQLEDKKLQEELNKALALLAESNDRGAKPVVIEFGGEQGAESLSAGLGYLLEAPVWKTSYRLDLTGPEAEGEEKELAGEDRGEGDAYLQGWAIVENTTEADWEGVELTLISGRPISFIQDLYTPLYVARPEVQPELYASLQPRRYEGGFEQEGRRLAEARDEAKLAGRARESLARKAPGAPAADMARSGATFGDMAEAEADDDMGFFDPSQLQSAASGGTVGELFEYTVKEPVSLARMKSSMLPILTSAVSAEKVSIYNQSVQPKHPLNGAVLKNTTDAKLMAGPVTVYDAGTYAGDAQIDFMAPGEDRLLSYAVDLAVRVDPSTKSSSSVIDGKIVRGVLQVQHEQTWEQMYKIANESAKTKTLVIEHPKVGGRELVDPEKAWETTPQLYRFKAEVEAGQESAFRVKEKRVYWQGVALVNADADTLVYWQRQGKISDEVREALQPAIDKKRELTTIERKVADIERELRRLSQEQSRLRSNLSSVDRKSEFGKRMVSKLDTTETKIEELQSEREDLREQMEKTRKALADYLEKLSVGGDG